MSRDVVSVTSAAAPRRLTSLPREPPGLGLSLLRSPALPSLAAPSWFPHGAPAPQLARGMLPFLESLTGLSSLDIFI